MVDQYLSLKKAIESNSLEQFIRQAETAGVGPVDEGQFFKAAARVIKTRETIRSNIAFCISRWFDNLSDVLKTNLIPDSLFDDDFEKFVEERADLLVDAGNVAMGK